MSSNAAPRTPISQTTPTPDKETPVNYTEIPEVPNGTTNPLLDDVLADVEAELAELALPGPGPVEREVMREMVDSVISSTASAYRASVYDPYEGTVDDDFAGEW